jgi:hypothetical protein
MTSIIKPNYPGASVALTSTNLQGLLYSSGGVLMWSSAAVDNTSNLSIDEIVTWKIITGTGPTAGTFVECWLWEMMDDSVYPDTLTGLEGAFTLTSANVKLSGVFKPANSITVDSNNGRTYYNSFRLSQAFGMPPPKKWGAGVVNVTGVALGSGCVISRIPLQIQNV